MDCSSTRSINPSHAAMTLIEMLVATGVGSLVLLVLGSLTLYSARNFRSMLDYSDLNRTSRMALDKISREIRQSRGLKSASESALVFQMDTNGATNVSILFDKTNKTLRMVSRSETNNLSTNCNCTAFTWSLFNGNSDPVTNWNSCKMVQLNFTFSRNSQRTITNTESVQSMKIVIRKKAS
jgi:Tfp pilus assembly protein PilW